MSPSKSPSKSAAKSGSLKLISQPQEFFRELIIQALGHQKLSTLPATEFYLVNLLGQFMKTEHLYAQDADGSLRQEPLALMMKEALEQSQSQAQQLMFRHVGDVSLYVAGYFQDSLNRKSVDVDYYIDMGEAAYQQVAARTDGGVFRSLYSELSRKFANFVEVLAEVSDRTSQKTEKDLLRIYEMWIRTRSKRAAKALQEAGILPHSSAPKKGMQ